MSSAVLFFRRLLAWPRAPLEEVEGLGDDPKGGAEQGDAAAGRRCRGEKHPPPP